MAQAMMQYQDESLTTPQKRKRETTPDAPRKRRKSYIKKPTQGFVLHFTDCPDDIGDEIRSDLKANYPEGEVEFYKADLVRILPTNQEKKEIKRETRKKYLDSLSPEERKTKFESQEAKDKKKLYNLKPRVIEKKKNRAIVGRMVYKKMQEKYPTEYRRLLDEKLKEFPPTIFSSSSSSSEAEEIESTIEESEVNKK